MNAGCALPKTIHYVFKYKISISLTTKRNLITCFLLCIFLFNVSARFSIDTFPVLSLKTASIWNKTLWKTCVICTLEFINHYILYSIHYILYTIYYAINFVLVYYVFINLFLDHINIRIFPQSMVFIHRK